MWGFEKVVEKLEGSLENLKIVEKLKNSLEIKSEA